jgi:hypothetical protein
VGNDVQVRRRGKRGHHLLLHDADRDDQRFVLVSGLIPTFQIHGWIYGHDGKTAEFFGDPYNTGRPCFWVPQDRLEPFDTFTMERALTA